MKYMSTIAVSLFAIGAQALLATTSVANAASPTKGQIKISGKSLCMAVGHNSTKKGAKIILWDCQRRNKGHTWFLDGKQIKNALSGKCLSVHSGSKKQGSGVVQWECHGGPDQEWERGSENALVNIGSNHCLSVWKGELKAGHGTRLSFIFVAPTIEKLVREF